MDVLSFVLTAVAAGAGAYFGSYLKKKGENLATHEDVDKLVVQVAAVTQTTKEIESKISTEVWQRQRAWEVKRDALFGAVNKLAAVQYAVHGVTSTYQAAAKDKSVIQQSEWTRLKLEKTSALDKAMLEFEQARALASLVCDLELQLSFAQVTLTMSQLTMSAMKSDYDNLEDVLSKIREQIDHLLTRVRSQLGAPA